MLPQTLTGSTGYIFLMLVIVIFFILIKLFQYRYAAKQRAVKVFPFQNYLARNFYNLRFLALFVCFAINFILLFYKVTPFSQVRENSDP